MKSKELWVRRFLWMTGIVFMILLGAAMLRGRSIDIALSESFIWALISSGVFTGWRYYQARKQSACRLCKDTPES